MKRKIAIIPIILTILLVIGLCCICVCLILFASGAVILSQIETYSSHSTLDTQPTPGTINTDPVDVNAFITLDTLESVIVPVNDPIELVNRFGGLSNIPDVVFDQDAPYEVGDMQNFWVSNVDTNENFMITAILGYVGENTYFWIEEGVEYEQSDLDALGNTFDQVIVPTNREFFGMEWNPGVDGDPHIYIVYAGGLGYSLAGYFSSADELNPMAHEYSNAHEMFLINSDNVYLWEEYIYGTLAHEYQHMIHWYTDRNESTWLNEGFSMLAELLNGYDVGGHDDSYLYQTDVQLTDWGDDVGTNSPYYGASFLFMTYFLDRFGEEASKALVAHPENSMESIDLVLSEMGAINPETGQPFTAEDVFADWAVANYLQDPSLADGRYGYSNYDPSQATLTETISGSTSETLSRYVCQYGVDTIRLTNIQGDFTLNFTGSTTVDVLPIGAYSENYAFYSNKGDESDMTLTREFDFSSVDAPITLSYYTWYDLEEDYDYLYLGVSVDGENWSILTTPSCTTLDPSGNSFGCGYNGSTDGWVLETVDLSAYAGEKVSLRFEYITDAAVNGEGFLLDDVSVDAVGYFTDFEDDDGGWVPDGFARITNELPQTFRVSLITLNGTAIVTPVALSETNTASIELSLDSTDEIILVISGTTPHTNQKASYQIELEQ
jgi:immune inhibitor A